MSVHSASGLDSWEVSFVKSLTAFHLEKLCHLFDAVEETGSWPAALTYGFLTLTPKPDSDGSPATLLAVSILSVLYRLWASTRLKELISWQESWVHSSQTGFRVGKSLWILGSRWLWPSRKHYSRVLTLQAVFLILKKHSTFYRYTNNPAACSETGLPKPFATCLSNLYTRLQRFVKFSKGFGSTPLISDTGHCSGMSYFCYSSQPFSHGFFKGC